MPRLRACLPTLAVFALALSLAACAVPQRLERPSLRESAPLAGLPASADATWPQAQWWRQWHDPQLDALQQRALTASPSLAQAEARLQLAERAITIAEAGAGLSGGASAQVQRQRLSERGLIPAQFLGFTWHNQADIALQARYTFDFWGRQRAAVAAARNEAEAAAAEVASARLAVTAAVAQAYFGWQAIQARLQLARERQAQLAEAARITRLRVERGIERADSESESAASQAAAAEAVAALEGALRLQQAVLAALLGDSPADLGRLEPHPLPIARAALPADASLDLLGRRPDLAARRWLVEAALARSDEARAAFYPDISLGAMAGLSSIDLGKLLSSGSRVAAFGPALNLPLFNQRPLRAAFGVSEAQLAAAATDYDAAVVDAARELATRTLELAQLAAREGERRRQLVAHETLLASARRRVEQGVADRRTELVAEIGLLEQREALLQLQAEALAAEIGLVQALGGGWQASPDASPTAGSATPESDHLPKAPVR